MAWKVSAIALVALALSAPVAVAGYCDAREAETVFACRIDGSSRAVNVCRHEDNSFQYAYGKPGKTPELELRQTAPDVVYTPWNGVGRSIWASLAFRNGSYRYEVSFNYDRFDNGPEQGTLTVYRGKDVLATKFCRAETLTHILPDLESSF